MIINHSFFKNNYQYCNLLNISIDQMNQIKVLKQPNIAH